MTTFLEIIGAAACLVIFMFLMSLGFVGIKDGVSHLKRKYAIKHRFDKPPTAKCYCVDCESYSKHNGACRTHAGWSVADSWFCWSATPRAAAPRQRRCLRRRENECGG